MPKRVFTQVQERYENKRKHHPLVPPALGFFLLSILWARPCLAAEELVTTAHLQDGEQVPYVLNYSSPSPRYVIILFPGGSGRMNPHMEDGLLVYSFKDNFLIRSRKFIVDDEFAAVATNSTTSKERIQSLIDDVKARFPRAKIYLMGTSKGTYATMELAEYLSDKIAGEILTSSMSPIYYFDARKYKNRHLVVHHKNDICRNTPFDSAEKSHTKYGNDFIAMEGGISTGDLCGPSAHHGYNGIEEQTVAAIKKWIKNGE
jgi:hypothetical protein